MIKIDIFSGFLGAGKTTLIKKLLADGYKGEKVVLIENEFGEIGIDGGFLKEAGVEITEMNSGCICCSLVGDFGEALVKVKEQFHPDRIIIEPSGVGKLSDVEKAVADIKDPEFEINSLVTVVDAGKCRIYMKNFGEFFNNQVEYAHTILLSRSQNVSEDKLQACVAMLREKNADAVIVTTPWDQLTGAQILHAISVKVDLSKILFEEEDICPCCGHHHNEDEECDHEHHHHHHHDDDEECCCGHHHDDDDDDDHDHEHHYHDDHEHHHHYDENGNCSCGHHHDDDDDHDHEHHHDHGHHHHHHHHHADEVFTSWGMESPKKYDESVLEDILEKLANSEEYGIILRAKGIVPSTDGRWLHFDLTPGEFEIREGASDIIGRLCVIGSQLKEKEIADLFEA